ncbi:MAG: hypothetical protein HZA31_00750 [Opitutae bacterium]|nr:hypothetical protein [Opitutae bacterium]
MATTPESKPADTPVLHPVDSFAMKLHKFWEKNRSVVLSFCVLVLVAILAKGGYEIYSAQREAGIQKAYAAANGTAGLKAFAAAHSGHTLAAVAYLRLADEAYAAGNYPEALVSYDQAAGMFKEQVFAGRAKLGAAMTKLISGKNAEGEAGLKQLADDAKQLKGLRVEAAYHLASNAASANKADEARKYADLITQLDAGSMWMQRAMMLRANLPAAPAPAAAAPAAKDSAVGIKLPGQK